MLTSTAAIFDHNHKPTPEMNTCEILQRTIHQGPYRGMVETITNANLKMPFLCYFCGQEPGNSAYRSIIGDSRGNAYCCRCLCASCAREQINGIPERAGKSPYQSLDPRKERRRLQARKNGTRERRKEAVMRVLFGLVIALVYLAAAAFIVGFFFMIAMIFAGR